MKIRLYKKWVIIGIILSMLIGFGAAYGTEYITKEFRSGVTISGDIVVIAPPPTVDDIGIESISTFTINVGDVTPISGSIVISNASGRDLTYVDLDLYWPPQLGTMVVDVGSLDASLSRYSQHTIPLIFTPVAQPIDGNYHYSGNITYSYE